MNASNEKQFLILSRQQGQEVLQEIEVLNRSNRRLTIKMIFDLKACDIQDKKFVNDLLLRVNAIRKQENVTIIWFYAAQGEVLKAGRFFQFMFNFNFQLKKKLPVQVLLAEPDPMIAKLLTINFRRKGIHVDHAVDGKQALDYLKFNAYQKVVTEIDLDYFSGLEICQSTYQKTSTTVFSKTHNIFKAKKAFNIQAIDYIPKPTSLGTLVNTITDSLREPNYGRLAS